MHYPPGYQTTLMSGLKCVYKCMLQLNFCFCFFFWFGFVYNNTCGGGGSLLFSSNLARGVHVHASSEPRETRRNKETARTARAVDQFRIDFMQCNALHKLLNRKEGKPPLFKETLRSHFTRLACQHFSFHVKKSLDHSLLLCGQSVSFCASPVSRFSHARGHLRFSRVLPAGPRKKRDCVQPGEGRGVKEKYSFSSKITLPT